MRILACVIACTACKQPDAKIVIGTTPTAPFGAVSGLAPGATLADVKRELPQATFEPNGKVATYREGDAVYTIELVDGLVDRIEIFALKHPVGDLFAAWGGSGDVDSDSNHQFWDRVHGMRADVRSDASPTAFRVAFMHYKPLAKLIEGNDLGAIDHIEILGRPLADVVHDFKLHRYAIQLQDDQHATVVMPRDEWSLSGVELALTVAPAGETYSLALTSNATPHITKQVHDIVSTRYGEPIKTDKDGIYFSEHPLVQLSTANVLIVTDDSRLAGSGSSSAP